jgi:iron(III) transport system substrate-binding protein
MRKLAALILLIGGAAAAYYWYVNREPDQVSLVVYCAHDEEFASQILRDFEEETGIRIITRYDSEATKSLGLINLLIKEQIQPQCDVFWNNELIGMSDLEEQGLLQRYRGDGYARIPDKYKDPDGHWTGFAARMRVYIVNPEKIKPDTAVIQEKLETSDDLTRVAMAQPIFGTTLTHYTLLQHEWGGDKLRAWHHDLHKRGLRDVQGNAAAKDLVAGGACDFAFTDSDDFFVAKDAGSQVEMAPVRVGEKTICIPNSVAIVNGTRRLAAAQKLVDYLLSAETELKLARSRSRQIPLGPIDETQLPTDVLPLFEWASQAADLRDLLPSRQAVLIWLKSEYLK